MAGNALPAELASHFMGLTLQTVNVAQANFVTAVKELDTDYIEGKRIISLPEALGAREVQSTTTPGGPVHA